MMLNWAQWRDGGAQADGISMTNAYDLAPRGRRDPKATTLLNGEAIDVEAAVNALPPDLYSVVIEYWTKKGNTEKHARACRCAVATFYRRLDHAHERIRALMQAKRDQAERSKRNYHRLRSGNLVDTTS